MKNARAELGKICDNIDATAQDIEQAIENCKAAGYSAYELAEANEAATRAARRRRARDALASAMRSREEEALRRAIELADEAALDHQEVQGAISLIEELEGVGANGCSDAVTRAKAVDCLTAAIKNRGTQELQDAITLAQKCGLGAKHQRALLAEARLTLKVVLARKQAAQERRERAGDTVSGG
jgi:hypothetical protein